MARRKPPPPLHTLPGFWVMLAGIVVGIALAVLYEPAGIGVGVGLTGLGAGFGMLGKARRWKGASGAGWILAGIGVLVVVLAVLNL